MYARRVASGASKSMGVATEDTGFSFPKNLSVWWSEETEYVLQRIERWAAYARGYNRLRSVLLSPGRMTMEEPGSRWSIDQNNKLAVENSWSPNFRQRRQHQSAERSRLRCCALGNLDYKSNAKLDSNCLETYSLDHSIYFKTIGELRSEARPESKATKSENGNVVADGGGDKRQKPNTPLDCGDFLSSDFDELDDEEDPEAFDQIDRELRTRCYGASDSDYDEDNDEESPGRVIQVCRSVMSEDEMNNNLRLSGLPRKFDHPAVAAAAAQ